MAHNSHLHSDKTGETARAELSLNTSPPPPQPPKKKKKKKKTKKNIHGLGWTSFEYKARG